MWGLIVSVPDHCLSFYFVGSWIFPGPMADCSGNLAKTLQNLQNRMYTHRRLRSAWAFAHTDQTSNGMLWIAKNSRTFYPVRENADQTARIHRLVCLRCTHRFLFCCGSLLLLVLAVRIYTLVHLLCEWHILVKWPPVWERAVHSAYRACLS